MGYQEYRDIIKDKLLAIVDDESDPLFAEAVYAVAEADPQGYPCAFVTERTGGGQILDTHRNQREWQFDVTVVVKADAEDPETAQDNLLYASDAVIKMFDEDPMLLDDNQQAQCIWCRVVPARFDYGINGGANHRCVITVAIVNVVNRYAAA